MCLSSNFFQHVWTTFVFSYRFQFFKKTVLLIEKSLWKVKCMVRLIESTEYLEKAVNKIKKKRNKSVQIRWYEPNWMKWDWFWPKWIIRDQIGSNQLKLVPIKCGKLLKLGVIRINGFANIWGLGLVPHPCPIFCLVVQNSLLFNHFVRKLGDF